MDATQAFFRQAREIAGGVPGRVTTDDHDAYPRASREVLGLEVAHRTGRYKNNQIE